MSVSHCLSETKSGKIRLWVDYLKVNELVKPSAFPHPRMSDCLDAVAGSSFFSTFDCTAGYHQILVLKEDIPKKAFCTKYGQYEFTTMPFGLNGSAVLPKNYETFLKGLKWTTAIIYIYTIL